MHRRSVLSIAGLAPAAVLASQAGGAAFAVGPHAEADSKPGKDGAPAANRTPANRTPANRTAANRTSGPRRTEIPPDLRPGGAFDRRLRRLAERDEFSGTVLLSFRDEQVLTRAYGMADRERGIPNRLDTIFSLASITKLFTGTAVAKLVSEGKLAYGDLVGKFLDGFPNEVAETVTVHHLLTHTSGFGRPPGGGDNPEWNSIDEF